MADNKNKYCLVFTLSKPWENYHREQFIKNIAIKIKNDGGYILCLEPTILTVLNLIYYPERIFKWFKGKYSFRKTDDNIFAVPAHTFEHILVSVRLVFLKWINIKILRKQIASSLRKMNINEDNFYLVLHRPELCFMAGALGERGVIYDCCDDHCLTSNMNTLKVRGNTEFEKKLSEKCNFVITTSLKLYNRNKRYNTNTYLLENGFGFEDSAFNSNAESFMKNIKQPVIAYIGNLRDWVDFELLEFLFSANSDYSFVFIGDVDKDSVKTFNKLKEKYSNVFLTGKVNYNNFPVYMKYARVGIIPFKENEFMESVNPNKFYEMIASGLPIVSTNIGDIKEKYSEIAKVGSNKEDFNRGIKELIDMKNVDYNTLRDKILKIAENHTWGKKADKFVKLLYDLP